MKSAITTAMLFCCVTGAATAEPAREPTSEMMLGQFACSTFPGQGTKVQGSLVLTGTAGLFQSGREGEPISVVVNLAPGGLPACDTFARDARARVQTVGGCTVGQIIAVDPDENNAQAIRSVQFVCSGSRDVVVASLARLIELIVTSGR